MNVLSRSPCEAADPAKEEKYYELFLLEFATGLRLGELTALQWEELNLTTGELRTQAGGGHRLGIGHH